MANSLFPLLFLYKKKEWKHHLSELIKAMALTISFVDVDGLAYDNGLLHTTQELKYKIKYI